MSKKLRVPEWVERVENGTLIITPVGIEMRVRGGGIGSNGWVARITGTHPEYRYAREFVRSTDDLSRSRKSGHRSWAWPTEEDDRIIEGLYEYRGLCTTSSRSASGYLAVVGGRIAQLDSDQADALLTALLDGAPLEWLGAWAQTGKAAS